MKFKKGDRIKRIEGNDHPEYKMFKNNVYTVERISELTVWVKENRIKDTGFSPRFFELVEKSDNYEIF